MKIIQKQRVDGGFVCLVHRGDLEFVTCFLRAGADIREDGWIWGHYFYGEAGRAEAEKDFEKRSGRSF